MKITCWLIPSASWRLPGPRAVLGAGERDPEGEVPRLLAGLPAHGLGPQNESSLEFGQTPGPGWGTPASHPEHRPGSHEDSAAGARRAEHAAYFALRASRPQREMGPLNRQFLAKSFLGPFSSRRCRVFCALWLITCG